MAESHIALTVISTSQSYQTRLALARHPSPTFRALEWTSIAVQEAKRLTKQFGEEFSAMEILQAAWELEEYYQLDLKERQTD